MHDIGKNIVGVVLQCNDYEVIDLGVMVPCARILETARREQADLDRTVRPDHSVARGDVVRRERDEREGFKVPLLIGGATTSPGPHGGQDRTELPRPVGPRARRVDARSASPVTCSSETLAEGFVAGVRKEYSDLREQRSQRQPAEDRLPIAEARRHRVVIDWNATRAVEPCRLGLTVLATMP